MTVEDHSTPKWQVFRVKRFREKELARQLSALGYEVFLPLVSKPHKIKGKLVERRFPLISGYVFVLIPPAAIEVLRYTPGILCPLVFDNKPVSVTPSDIRLMEIACSHGGSEVEVVELGNTSGKLVQIKSGPFAGYEGLQPDGMPAPHCYVSLGIPGTCLRILIRNKNH
ncbi:MAG: UpxY family transcription antiterminator [Bacteroidales bacterium]|nr:UpxY family transcription antiterminator [Bacteroidales bacterium]